MKKFYVKHIHWEKDKLPFIVDYLRDGENELECLRHWFRGSYILFKTHYKGDKIVKHYIPLLDDIYVKKNSIFIVEEKEN